MSTEWWNVFKQVDLHEYEPCECGAGKVMNRQKLSKENLKRQKIIQTKRDHQIKLLLMLLY